VKALKSENKTPYVTIHTYNKKPSCHYSRPQCLTADYLVISD